MNQNLLLILLNAAMAGAVGGYAVTQWGLPGAALAPAIAMAFGFWIRRGRRKGKLCRPLLVNSDQNPQ